MTAPLESTHLSWRGSLLTHVLCGQLAGLERHSAAAEVRSLSTCLQVSPQVHFSQQLRKADLEAMRTVRSCR